MIISSIDKIDNQLKQKSYENILLSGGNMAFNGLNEQLISEMKNKLSKDTKINLKKSENPQYSCWIGGNIISTLEIFKKMWITRKDYNENGNKIIHVKTI